MLGTDHGQMDHGKMDHGSSPPPTAAAEGDTGKAASMDHGSMQGGSAHLMPATPCLFGRLYSRSGRTTVAARR